MSDQQTAILSLIAKLIVDAADLHRAVAQEDETYAAKDLGAISTAHTAIAVAIQTWRPEWRLA